MSIIECGKASKGKIEDNLSKTSTVFLKDFERLSLYKKSGISY